MQSERFYAHGKLLLTGEYLVLHGATALAVPTRQGQWLEVHPNDGGDLSWQAWDDAGHKWFEARFSLPDFRCSSSSDPVVAQRLSQLLLAAQRLKPDILPANQGVLVHTRLEFNRQWGLGSSSSLVALLAQWLQIPAFDLFFATQSGSGYDLACAQASGPLLYTLSANKKPQVQAVRFNPPFKKQLLFVYLGQKQLSEREVRAYLGAGAAPDALVQQVSDLSRSMLNTEQLDEFSELLAEHEALLASELKRQPVQKLLFGDYPGQVKSLGAWGGDFVLATAPDLAAACHWLETHNFKTVRTYEEMI